MGRCEFFDHLVRRRAAEHGSGVEGCGLKRLQNGDGIRHRKILLKIVLVFYTALPYREAMYYEFIELVPFAAVRDELFGDEQFLELQWYLCRRPEAGDVFPETGGCRKLRWKVQGKGKRGGARVIYFLRTEAGQIVLVAAYGKNELDDVPRQWLRKLKEHYDE